MPATRPTRTFILGVLLAAAIIGFLGGSLAGLIEAGRPLLGSSGDTTQTTDSATPTATADGTTLTLESDVASVSPNGAIRLSGQLQPAAQVTLQVQRRLDGGDWSNFPVTTRSGEDGSFSTAVRSGRSGVNDFRVVTEVDGEQVTSPAVTVTIS